jgi:hypothetical protein
MIESNLTLTLNAEEHELVNTALIHLLDAAEEMHNWDAYHNDENPRIEMLRQLRNRSVELWSQRFN